MLETKGQHLLRSRANKGDARRLAAAHETGVLAEKTVTGVYGLGARLGGNGKQLIDLQVGISSGAVT